MTSSLSDRERRGLWLDYMAEAVRSTLRSRGD